MEEKGITESVTYTYEFPVLYLTVGYNEYVPSGLPTADTVQVQWGKQIVVKPNGGTWEGSTADQTLQIKIDKTLTDPTREGYAFLGWICEPGSGDVSFTFTAQWRQLPTYTVQYLEEGTHATLYTEKVVNVTDPTVISTQVTETAVDITGYEVVESANRSITVQWDSAQNVITFYYAKRIFNYTVEHYYDGVRDDSKTVTNSAPYKAEITQYVSKVTDGYVLDYTENLPLTISADTAENVIKVYYAKSGDGNVPDYQQAFVQFVTGGNGTVTGETSQTFTLVGNNGVYAGQVTPAAVTVTPIPGYEFSHWTNAGGEEVNPFDPQNVSGGNTYVFTANFKPTIGTATVTFKVVGGTWADGTSADKTVDVQLVAGCGTLLETDVPEGMRPANGYTTPAAWDVEPNVEEKGITESVTYTYTFTVVPLLWFRTSAQQNCLKWTLWTPATA